MLDPSSSICLQGLLYIVDIYHRHTSRTCRFFEPRMLCRAPMMAGGWIAAARRRHDPGRKGLFPTVKRKRPKHAETWLVWCRKGSLEFQMRGPVAHAQHLEYVKQIVSIKSTNLENLVQQLLSMLASCHSQYCHRWKMHTFSHLSSLLLKIRLSFQVTQVLVTLLQSWFNMLKTHWRRFFFFKFRESTPWESSLNLAWHLGPVIFSRQKLLIPSSEEVPEDSEELLKLKGAGGTGWRLQ